MRIWAVCPSGCLDSGNTAPLTPSAKLWLPNPVRACSDTSCCSRATLQVAPPQLSPMWPEVSGASGTDSSRPPQLTVTGTRPPHLCSPACLTDLGSKDTAAQPTQAQTSSRPSKSWPDTMQVSAQKAQVSNGRTMNRKTPFPPGLNLSGGFKPASCSTKNTQFCCALQAQRTPSKSYKDGKDNFLLSSNGEMLILVQQLSHTLPHIKGSNMSTPPLETYRQNLAKTLTNTVTSWQFRLSFFGRCVY